MPLYRRVHVCACKLILCVICVLSGVRCMQVVSCKPYHMLGQDVAVEWMAGHACMHKLPVKWCWQWDGLSSDTDMHHGEFVPRLSTPGTHAHQSYVLLRHSCEPYITSLSIFDNQWTKRSIARPAHGNADARPSCPAAAARQLRTDRSCMALRVPRRHSGEASVP